MLAASVAVDARGQDASALARVGTAAIDDHRFGDALAAFTRAAALQPDDASLGLGAGLAAFMLGQNDIAQSRLESALSLDPANRQAALWLGDLHYRAGRLGEAITIYEAALQRSPRDRELRDRLAAWRREEELESRLRRVRSEHFTVLFQAADEPIASHALESLEAAYSRVGHTLGVYPSQQITAVIYARREFDAITRLATWSAAAYDGRIRIPLSDALHERGELDRVLSHEFVHALVAMIGGRTVPAWVNEGLATVLESADQPVVDATPRTGARTDLAGLHRSFVDFSRRDAEVAYASSARGVRRLIEQQGAAVVVALLEDLRRGVPFASAFQARISMRYEDFAALAAVSNP